MRWEFAETLWRAEAQDTDLDLGMAGLVVRSACPSPGSEVWPASTRDSRVWERRVRCDSRVTMSENNK